jgi:hypothetical protein
MKLLKLLTVGAVILGMLCSSIWFFFMPNYRYKKTLVFGMKNIKWAEQMERWYGPKKVDHMITHYGFSPSKPVTWTTIAYLYGRYELWVKVDVRVDYDKCVITGFEGDPKFYLFENKIIEISSNGQIGVRQEDPKNVTDVDSETWKKLEAVNGDLGILPGIDKNKPLANFWEMRKGRGHVLNSR